MKTAPRALLALAAALCALSARAQTPPLPAEIAAYLGLPAAIMRGDAAGVAALARDPTTIERRDGAGRTPLHLAAFQRRPDFVKLLMSLGADPDALDAQRYDAVTIAAVNDDEATLDALLRAGASAKLVTSPYDGTALIAAAHLGHDGVVRRLIAAGAPLDHINNLGWTALIEAVVLGDGGPRHVATVKALVEAGARRDLPDRQGATPVALAERRGFADMVAILRGS
jgi:ankyrin repeat protein